MPDGRASFGTRSESLSAAHSTPHGSQNDVTVTLVMDDSASSALVQRQRRALIASVCAGVVLLVSGSLTVITFLPEPTVAPGLVPPTSSASAEPPIASLEPSAPSAGPTPSALPQLTGPSSAQPQAGRPAPTPSAKPVSPSVKPSSPRPTPPPDIGERCMDELVTHGYVAWTPCIEMTAGTVLATSFMHTRFRSPNAQSGKVSWELRTVITDTTSLPHVVVASKTCTGIDDLAVANKPVDKCVASHLYVSGHKYRASISIRYGTSGGTNSVDLAPPGSQP